MMTRRRTPPPLYPPLRLVRGEGTGCRPATGWQRPPTRGGHRPAEPARPTATRRLRPGDVIARMRVLRDVGSGLRAGDLLELRGSGDPTSFGVGSVYLVRQTPLDYGWALALENDGRAELILPPEPPDGGGLPMRLVA